MPDTFLKQLESLTPGRVMQLAGSPQAFLAGVDLYQQEAVSFQGWSQDRSAALFHYKNRGVHLIDGGSITSLGWDCELCGSAETPCSHVIAILATMAHAWKRQVSFASPDANAEFFENLRCQLLGESSEGAAAVRDGFCLTITTDSTGGFDLLVRSPKGEYRYSPDAVTAEPRSPLLPPPLKELLENAADSAEKREVEFLEWFHEHRSEQWPLRFLPAPPVTPAFPRSEEFVVIEKPPSEQLHHAVLRFTHHSESESIKCERLIVPVLEDGEDDDDGESGRKPSISPTADFHRLGRHLVYVPSSGQICFVANPIHWLALDTMPFRLKTPDRRFELATAFPRNPSPILKRSQFNEISWPWKESAIAAGSGGSGANKSIILQTADRPPGDSDRPTPTSTTGSLNLSLQTRGESATQNSPAVLTPELMTSEGIHDTSSFPSLLDDLDELDDRYGGKLLAVKKRRLRIHASLGRLLLSESEAEANLAYDEVWKSDAFTRDQDRAAALAYLKQATELFRTNQPGRILVSPKTGNHTNGATTSWRVTEPGPLASVPFVAVTIKHFPGAWEGITGENPEMNRSGDVRNGRASDDAFHLLIDRDEVIANLAAFCNECETLGIPLTLNGRPVEIAGLDLKMEAQAVSGDSTNPESPAIDWFEMKPQVVCQGVSISEDRWKEILKRGILENSANGEGDEPNIVILDDESLKRLRLLAGTIQSERSASMASAGGKGKSRGKKKGPLRVSRLQIFDWMLLSEQGIGIELPEEEQRVLDSITGLSPHRPAPVPDGFADTFRPYQARGYQWLAYLYEHKFGAVLADDMGLGKTPQSIGLLAGLGAGIVPNRPQDRRFHLVIVPPTLLFNWQAEIAKFAPHLTVYEYIGANRNTDAFQNVDIVLTTYELARRDMEKLEGVPFDVVIFDEAQAAKNMTAARSKAIRRLNARFRICLTGTPMENHAGEYFAILDLAIPGLMGEYQLFRRMMRDGKGDQLLRRARPFVLRRTKVNVLTELPPKNEFDTYLQLSKKQKEFYTRTVAEVRKEVAAAFDQKAGQQAGIVALAALMRLRQICVDPAILDKAVKEPSPKLVHLVNKLDTLNDEGDSALVFSQFTRALDVLEPVLKKAGLEFARLDGSTPTPSRKKRIEAFQSGKGPRIFLISLKAGGSGLNLTEASHVFHLDPWWNPAVEDQASDRAHRIGQTKTVFIHRLLMRDTIEQKMMILKARKKELYDRIISANVEEAGAEGQQGPAITREDLSFLLEG